MLSPLLGERMHFDRSKKREFIALLGGAGGGGAGRHPELRLIGSA